MAEFDTPQGRVFSFDGASFALADGVWTCVHSARAAAPFTRQDDQAIAFEGAWFHDTGGELRRAASPLGASVSPSVVRDGYVSVDGGSMRVATVVEVDEPA